MGPAPGEIYSKTFLRTYADYLGLDSRELVDDYRRQHERPTDHDLRPLSSGRDRDRRLGRGRGRQPQPRSGGFPIPPWIVVLLVLVIVGIALYAVGTLSNKKNNSPTAVTTTHHHHPKHQQHHGGASTKHKAPVNVRLSLVATGSVYVCLVNGNGHKLINGKTLAAGDHVPEQVAKKLLLTLGTSSVKLKANGVSVPVAPSSSPIGLKFTPGKHSSLPAASQPHC